MSVRTASIPAGAGATRPVSRVPRLPSWALPAFSVLVVLAIFEFSARVGIVDSNTFPPVTTILEAFGELVQTSGFWQALRETMTGWALGFGIAFVLGVPLGLLIGSSSVVHRSLRLLLEFLRPIPPIAFLPIAILLLGTGAEMRVWMVAFACFFPIAFHGIYGVQDVDPVLRDVARSYGFSRWRVFGYVVVPSALPYIVTGARLAVTIALVVEVGTELVIGSDGLGAAINQVRAVGDTPAMYAFILACGLCGVAITIVWRAVERRLLKWHPSQRYDVAAL
jgi:ABC-type nitrate/sulfonate/bicarbonate transport system permease component